MGNIRGHRWWKSGPKRRDNRKLFMDRVYPEPNTGCWLYSGSYSKEGYGKLTSEYFNGFRSAHRFSYYLHFGDFDRNLCVMHKCDMPTCVNPDHLILGTNDDNMRDMVNKKRSPIGERNSKSKLTERDVIKIRELSKSISRREIMKIYGMSKTQIGSIIRHETWRHLP